MVEAMTYAGRMQLRVKCHGLPVRDPGTACPTFTTRAELVLQVHQKSRGVEQTQSGRSQRKSKRLAARTATTMSMIKRQS